MRKRTRSTIGTLFLIFTIISFIVLALGIAGLVSEAVSDAIFDNKVLGENERIYFTSAGLVGLLVFGALYTKLKNV